MHLRLWLLLLTCVLAEAQRLQLLLRRLFAYKDAQSYRVGPNFDLLPVNRPRCPLFNYRQDEPMNFVNQSGSINYYPSSFATQVGRATLKVCNIRPHARTFLHAPFLCACKGGKLLASMHSQQDQAPALYLMQMLHACRSP